MAVVDITARRELVKGNFKGDGQGDNVTQKYWVTFDAAITDPLLVLQNAQAFTTGTDRIPTRSEQYANGINMYAVVFNVSMLNEHALIWEIEVNWQSPPPGEQGSDLSTPPWLRPPKFKIEYIDKEIPITRAFALEDHISALFPRRIGEFGPITNTVGKETIDAVVDTIWNGVLTVTRWLSDLESVLIVNRNFQLTTNSDLVLERFPPRTLKYQVTQSGSVEDWNGSEFYEITTSIEILDTTDIYLNNVGYEQIVRVMKDNPQWAGPGDPDPSGEPRQIVETPPDSVPSSPTFGFYVNAEKETLAPIMNEGDPDRKDPKTFEPAPVAPSESKEPRFLDHSGTALRQAPGETSMVGYRYLKEVPYLQLIEDGPPPLPI